jgi:MazG family protein
MSNSRPDAFAELLAVVARLREPGGCPWDREQTHASLVPYVIEEAHEVAEAIESGDPARLREELGDVLLQVVLHARIAEEARQFDAHDVARDLCDKLVRRHPHVFADAHASSSAEVTQRWERIKQEEKRRKGDAAGILDGVPKALPALQKAQRLTEKAGKFGFDWPDAEAVLGKLREELGELEDDVRAGRREEARAEFGDVLFVMANMARHLGIDAEAALQSANGKFTRRFRHVEARLAEQGRSPAEADLAEMDALWEEAKRLERPDGGGAGSSGA